MQMGTLGYTLFSTGITFVLELLNWNQRVLPDRVNTSNTSIILHPSPRIRLQKWPFRAQYRVSVGFSSVNCIAKKCNKVIFLNVSHIRTTWPPLPRCWVA